MKMDPRKSVKRDRPENPTKTDSRDNGNMSFPNVESVFPVPELISSLSQCSSDDVLIASDLEKECQYAIVKENEMCYVCESSVDQNRVIVGDWKKKRLEVYEIKMPINVGATQAVIDLDGNERRWEGGVQNGSLFGYGVICNEEGV